jgi:hypothetical protein
MRVFLDSLRAYTELVASGMNLMESGLESELEPLRRQWRTAWADAEEARVALYRHELDHSCGTLIQEKRAQRGAA